MKKFEGVYQYCAIIQRLRPHSNILNVVVSEYNGELCEDSYFHWTVFPSNASINSQNKSEIFILRFMDANVETTHSNRFETLALIFTVTLLLIILYQLRSRIKDNRDA